MHHVKTLFNKWFEELGLFAMDKVAIGQLPPINRG